MLTDPQVMTHPYVPDIFLSKQISDTYLDHYPSGMIYYLGRAMLTQHLKLLPFNTSAIIIANGFSLKNWVMSSVISSMPKA